MRMSEESTFGRGVHLSGCNVYLVTNMETGLQYVGATTLTVAQRWVNHVQSRMVNRSPFQKAIKKHGAKAFHVRLLKQCDGMAAAFAEEKRLIKKLKTIHPNGYNGRYRKPCSKEVKEFFRSLDMPYDEAIEFFARRSIEFQQWAKKQPKKKTA